MPGEKHGEYFYLRDEGGGIYTDEVAVKGHVSPEEFEEAIAELREEYEALYDAEFPELAEPEHKWAFWARTAYHEGMTFMVRDEPGRGRFPVTVAEDMRLVKMRRRSEEKKRAVRDFVESRYPGTEIQLVMSLSRDDAALARFSFPGGQGLAQLKWYPDREADEQELTVDKRDVDAWNEYYDEQVGQ